MLLLLLVEEPYSFLIGYASSTLNTIPAPEPESPCPKTTLVIPAKAGTSLPPNNACQPIAIDCHGGLVPPPHYTNTVFPLAKTQRRKVLNMNLSFWKIFFASLRLSESIFISLEENAKQKVGEDLGVNGIVIKPARGCACQPISIGSRESWNLLNHICCVVMAGLTRHQTYPYFYNIILTTLTHGVHRLLPGTRNNKICYR